MNPRACRTIASWLLAVAVGAGPAAVLGAEDDLVVSYPLDATLVEKAYVPVEGYARAQGIDEIEIVVNDERPQRVRVRDRLFAEEVDLEEGLNTLRIGSVVRRVWFASAAAPPPAEYRRVYGHFGLDDSCLECHETDGEGAFTLADEREEICVWCHGDLVRGSRGVGWASVHAPVRSGKCLGCHDPHVSMKKGLPAQKPPACADCHAAVTDRLRTDRFVHGPMSLGDCRLCHTVHASAEPKLLVRPSTSLCTDCHSDILSPADTPAALRSHPMIPEGQCGRCHEPHSSPNQLLLRKPVARLCQGCHEGKTRSFHESKGFSIYVCGKCHDLHRPTQPHLIVEASRSLCTECHNFLGDAVFTHSFAAQGRCFLCHSFHEAPLSQDVATLCLGCHRDNPLLPEAHSGIPVERARCTTCHRPHQAGRKNLLRATEHTPFANGVCDSCHRERSAMIGPVYRPLCLDCHTALDLAKIAAPPAAVHPPFQDGDCSDCHSSHNADAPNLVRDPGGKNCLECHRKMRKATLLTPVSAHTAVLEGRCGDCHDPHFSQNDALLRKPQGELCPSCHAAVALAPSGEPWPVPHKPVAEGKCRLCHRHHNATNPDLLKYPLPQPCRPCHGIFFAKIEDPGLRSSHEPVRDGACGACHDLHGGARAQLLKAGARGEICRGCHPQLPGGHHLLSAAQLAAREGGSGAEANGCMHCHLPHASAQSRLLQPSSGSVCKGCHKT